MKKGCLTELLRREQARKRDAWRGDSPSGPKGNGSLGLGTDYNNRWRNSATLKGGLGLSNHIAIVLQTDNTQAGRTGPRERLSEKSQKGS